MTDLEILKELEEEIGYPLKEGEDYEFDILYDKTKYVAVLEIKCKTEFPNSLFYLQSLNVLSIDSQIEDFLPLLELSELRRLNIFCDKTSFLYSSKLKFFIEEASSFEEISIIYPLFNKKKGVVSFFSNQFEFQKEDIIYYGWFDDEENQFTLPLISTLSLGYNDKNLYLDYFFSNPHAKIFKEKTPTKDEIAAKLLEIYYTGYQKNEFPCAIRKIRICDYHGIDNLLIDDIAVDNDTKTIQDPHWIFLTGENGYGKTSILQAIVLALYGKEDKEGVILDKKKEANIFLELKENINPEFEGRQGLRINHVGKETEYDIGWIIPSMFTNFAAYGASRLNISNDEQNQTYSLFNSDGTLLNIENDLEKWYNKIDNDDLYQNIRFILIELLSPYIDELKVEEKDGDYTVLYHETETPSDDWKKFKELASGYKNIIATFGDMILRLRRQQPKVRNAKDLTGIVIIDEFDLHLHPKWQKELVEKLTKTFPKIQFIVSTHSPIPLLGAPKNSVIINVQRSEEEGITAQKLDIDFTKLTPNSILSSPIFGFDDIFSNETSADEVETADRYEDIENDERLRKKLNILKRTDEDFFNDLIGEE